MRNMLTTLAAAAVLATTGAAVSAAAPDEASDKAAVLDTYADIAHAAFEDALTEARRLKTAVDGLRSEEHTSELQSLMRRSYAVFCLKKKKTKKIDSRMNR